ncbi:DUF2254 domain-containing protein [Pseudolysinimonas sp.]|jgi:uncharacterized membrane protein|uniref:DUF2254 domain-containing protein n=1 Tax=Pseudolysinimonas sp. TaxID=2680009 RepID=UPI003783EBCD
MAHSDRRARGDRLRFASLRESLAARLWPTPVAAIVVAVALGVVVPIADAALDDRIPGWFAALLFSGGPDAARAVLAAIAGSLVSATTLTFSLTVVALQLASSQASPRVLRLFARDRVVHRTLAVFLATFAFALTVLRTVRDADDEGDAAVPRFAITLAFLLTVASVIMLVLFLAHLARQLRIETVMRDVHRETSATIDLLRGTGETPEDDAGAEPPPRPESARSADATASGFLTGTDRERLVDLAVEHDLVIEEVRAVGTNVVAGTPLAFWWFRDPLRRGGVADAEARDLARAITLAFGIAYERTPTQDIGFGLRQLLDIATRAVSPGINDPTTAVHALGHVAAVLSDLARLPEQAPVLVDDDGITRLLVQRHEFAALLETGIAQLRHYGAADPDVAARLYGALREVGYACRRDADRSAVEEQLSRLDATVAARDFDSVERERFARMSADARSALAGIWR